ncbi:sporulation integral membrane protein YtvI [Ectobacillus ponti]|uniref:Sporulation integral membrane protein YtvI n=1 Tax=Ectobacillus ponti TaxID=2961894 RepID=A0AA41X5X2_9BACI|nr:sporulation integral membrane protein YtvI [Ectobacillus ponti]MCP8967430.1 sporulation integral membrane protein YtvI [Ectobacillus ponti]
MNRNALYMAIRLAAIIVVTLLSIYVIVRLSGLMYPFIIAFIIAYMMNPLVDFLDRRLRFPRALAVFVSLVLVFGALGGLITLLITELIAALNFLLEILPEKFPKLVNYIQDFFVNSVMPLYQDLATKFSRLGESQQNTITTNIQNLGTELASNARSLLTSILSGLTNFISTLPTLATVFVFVLLATFFISNDWHRIGRGMKRLLPERMHGYSETIFGDLRRALLGFIKAQFTLVSMTTVIVLIGLLILRVPYAITIALVTGIVDLLPYLGTGAVFVPWILYIWFTGDTAFAIGLLILYIVVIVQRQLMEPKVLSSNIGLDPLPTLIALFVGFQLYGFLGLIIGPTALVVLKTLYDAHVFRDVWHFVRGPRT